MGVSETILAAMIGALATISAALFQLFSAFKSGEKVDPRAKRGSKFKSLLSIAALMVASAVGGFLYSEFLKQRSVEQMEAMRAELREVRELVAVSAGRSALSAPAPASQSAATPGAEVSNTSAVKTVAPEAPGRSEALIFVPACQSTAGGAECQENEAQRVALCATVPAKAQVESLELFAQPEASQQPLGDDQTWEQHVAKPEQDLGGARFTGSSFEYAQAARHKAVCVNFLHWSSAHPHLARLVVSYRSAEGSSTAAPAAPAVAPPEATVVNEPAGLAPQAASFIAPAAAESE